MDMGRVNRQRVHNPERRPVFYDAATLERIAWDAYRSYIGKLIVVDYLQGYDRDDRSREVYGVFVARVLGGGEPTSVARNWVSDDYLDPWWPCEIVAVVRVDDGEGYGTVDGIRSLRSLETEGPSYHPNAGLLNDMPPTVEVVSWGPPPTIRSSVLW